MAKSKGSFTANVSSGSSVGFSGIPGKGNYSVAFGQQFGKSFGKAYDKAKSKPKDIAPPKTNSTGSGLSSEDNVSGDKPTRPQRKQITNIYEGEVVEQGALPSGRKAIEDIIDAEVIETPKAIGGSRKAIEPPPLKALPAPKAPRASSPVRGTPTRGQQFTSVDKAGTATPMAKTPYGDAVRLD